ncbi:MAG: GDYXXLXY domain-containing protein [Calothrix sp. C42_A2020_038]|nr:GDYXXLXY domain-containing protein [Calothrix sp. C42_A2020_038]
MKTWRFTVPLLIQTAFILSIPAQAVYIHITGKTVVLQTVPVDPYDLLRGYSQTLSYDISRQDNLKKLPGWDEIVKKSPGVDKQYSPIAQNTTIYVTLQEQNSSGKIPPLPWKPVRVSFTKPSSLAPSQVAIKGTYQYGSVNYNLETYYLPEDQRDKINKDISEAQKVKPGEQQPFVVEAKVDNQGNAIPLTLWVKNRNYRF